MLDIDNKDMVGRWVQSLIDSDELHLFYVSKYWRRLRKKVLEESKDECQICKSKGKYTKANHVHHNLHVRDHPRFSLSRTYIFQGKERVNLIAVCKDCHENVCHPERLKQVKEQLNEERW